MPASTRHIMHADVDAFYAAVERLDNPELRGLPVLLSGRPEGREVVATVSYEARRFGIHSVMPMALPCASLPRASSSVPTWVKPAPYLAPSTPQGNRIALG